MGNCAFTKLGSQINGPSFDILINPDWRGYRLRYMRQLSSVNGEAHEVPLSCSAKAHMLQYIQRWNDMNREVMIH